jgi:SAM-dependent methyltransferase
MKRGGGTEMTSNANKKEQDWLSAIMEGENLANVRKVKEYLLPLLSRISNNSIGDLKLISIGCGFGADVDALVNSGVDAYGVEAFSRTQMWNSRQNKGRFIIADGRDLPFKNESFDIVLCLEVMEHVGDMGEEKGDANLLQEREKFAKELTRILKTGGGIILTTPNKRFPIDIGHGSNFLGVRIHSPFHDFTVSFREIKTWFVQKSGCSGITTLPYKNFITLDLWGKNCAIIRVFLPFVKVYLRMLDALKFLRASFLSPHLMLLIRK